MCCSVALDIPPSSMSVVAFSIASGVIFNATAALADGVYGMAGEMENNTGWW